jgi:hypothetical protein
VEEKNDLSETMLMAAAAEGRYVLLETNGWCKANNSLPTAHLIPTNIDFLFIHPENLVSNLFVLSV